MSSPSSRLVDLILRGARRAASIGGARTLQEQVDRKAAKPASPAPRGVGKRVAIEEVTLHGLPCYRLTPERPSGQHVLYLHGGSYTFEISPAHWWNLGNLARSAGATFTVVIYPLAPSSTADRTVPLVTALAADLAAQHTGLIVAGDSAGGGMALAVAQQLVASGAPPLRGLVLISPWLDVTMSDPAIDPIVPKDVMLDRQSLIDAGRLYAGPLDPADPLASPIHGEVAGLPPITMFCGSHDLFVVDNRAFAATARAAGVAVDYSEAPGGQHVYPLLPTREGKAARAHLTSVLRPSAFS